MNGRPDATIVHGRAGFGSSTAWVVTEHLREPSASGRRGVARSLTRSMVSMSFGVSESEVRVTQLCPQCGSDGHGRPTVRLPDLRPGPAASWAYADGLVCVAVGGATSIGVDLEAEPSSGSDALLTAASAVLGAQPSLSGRPADLLAVWTRVEAVTKAMGTGLPSAGRVRFHGDRATVTGDGAGREWSVTDLAVESTGPLLRGALAVEVRPGTRTPAAAATAVAPATPRRWAGGSGR